MSQFRLPRFSKSLNFLLALFLLFPLAFYKSVGVGLEGSWQIALHYAFERGINFGEGFVFTYGPLGILTTRLRFESSRLWIAAFDCLLLVVFVTVYCAMLRRLNTRRALLGIFCSVLAIDRAYYFADITVVLLIVLCALLLLHEETKRRGYLALAALLAVLLFFMKFNTGVPALVIAVGYAARLYWFGEKRSAAAMIGGIAAGIFLGASRLNVDFAAYALNGWRQISSYDEAMYLHPGTERQQVVRAAGLILWFGISLLCCVRQIIASRTAILASVLCGLLLGLLFKQAFVRADVHIAIFFHYAPMVFGLLWLYSTPRQKYFTGTGFLVSLILVLPFFANEFSFKTLRAKPQAMAAYFRDAWSAVAPGKSDESECQLPKRLVDLVSTGSVDIVPHDIAHLYYCRLKYHPRPVIQSYQAYTPELDRLNARHFLSELAPEYLFVSLFGLDDRYAMLDESQTKLAIMQRYELSARDGLWLLLKKRSEPIQPEVTQLAEHASELEQEIFIPNSPDMIYLELDVDYSLRGLLRKIFYQAPRLSLIITMEDGTKYTYRAIKPLLTSGFLASRFVAVTDDLANFFALRPDSIKQIRSVRLSSAIPGAYRQQARVRIKHVKLQAPEQRQLPHYFSKYYFPGVGEGDGLPSLPVSSPALG